MAERVAATTLPRKGRRVAAGAPAEDSQEGVLGSRILAYVIDSVILAVVAMVFVGVGWLTLVVSTDGALADARDPELKRFAYISLMSVPAWGLLNLALLWRRGQGIGQYVVGLAVVREDDGNPDLRQFAVYLMALHPLLFHPIVGGFWALSGYLLFTGTPSYGVAVTFGALVALCAAAPLVALVTEAADGGRRGLHDRVAGTKVVRLE